MTIGTMRVNGVDLDQAFGFRCAIPTGWSEAPAVTQQSVRVPGQAGVLRLSSERDVAARTLTINGYIRRTTADLARTAADATKLLLSSKDAEITFDEIPDRMALGEYQTIAIAQPVWAARWATFTIQFSCPSAHLIARTTSIYGITNGAGLVPLVLGTAPSPLDINLIGNDLANPTVTYVDAQGQIKGRVRFLLTLLTGDWIDWHGLTQNADWHHAIGGSQNAIPFLEPDPIPGTNTDPFSFDGDPLDGDGTVGPSLYVNNCTAVVLCRKAWL